MPKYVAVLIILIILTTVDIRAAEIPLESGTFTGYEESLILGVGILAIIIAVVILEVWERKQHQDFLELTELEKADKSCNKKDS